MEQERSSIRRDVERERLEPVAQRSKWIAKERAQRSGIGKLRPVCGQAVELPLQSEQRGKRKGRHSAKIEKNAGKQEAQQGLDIGNGDTESSRNRARIGKIESRLRREFQIGNLLRVAACAELEIDDLRVPCRFLSRVPGKRRLQ